MFENVIGNIKQKELLQNSIISNTVSHAYLFCGMKGCGKALLAKEFAKVLLNTDNLDTCLDYKYVCRDEDKKDLSVEKIRKEIIEDIYIAPVMSENKVYIIDDGQYLNASAQNALLKTLEEPPKYVHIIIISDRESNFLPTIISRVNKIKFSGISDDELKLYIKKMYNKELDNNLVKYINGSIGLATDIIINNKFETYNAVYNLYNYIIKKDIIGALTKSQGVFVDNDMLKYLEFLLYNNGNYLLVKFVEKAYIRLKNNGNYDIVIDNMILNMIKNI